jgi:hypothetical protein
MNPLFTFTHVVATIRLILKNTEPIGYFRVPHRGVKPVISDEAVEAELSDETSLETAEDPASDGWVIRVTVPDSGMALGIAELERQRKYAALDAIRELGSDDPNENPYRSQA